MRERNRGGELRHCCNAITLSAKNSFDKRTESSRVLYPEVCRFLNPGKNNTSRRDHDQQDHNANSYS